MDELQLQELSTFLSYGYLEILINIILSIIFGLIISFTYIKTHSGLSYSLSFTHTLVIVTLITTIVMMVIGGSLARAFALVGALSIIRFRTVLKDTKDLAYIFMSLVFGMSIGTSSYIISFLGIASSVTLLILLNSFKFGSVKKSDYILTFRSSSENNNYQSIFNDFLSKSKLIHVEPDVNNSTNKLTFDIELIQSEDLNSF